MKLSKRVKSNPQYKRFRALVAKSFTTNYFLRGIEKGKETFYNWMKTICMQQYSPKM